MSAIPQPNTSRQVSERLVDPLRQVARREWSVLAAKGIIQTLLVCLTLILVVALVIWQIDRYIVTYEAIPSIIRILVSLAVLGGIIYYAVRFLRPAMQKRSLVRTAMDVEQRMSASNDTEERITSALELTAERDERFRGSPMLVSHLVKQAEVDAARVQPDKLVPGDIVVKLGLLLIPVLIAWVAMTAWKPQPLMRSLFQLIMPWQNLPAVLSDVAVQPGDKTIIQGDAVDISAHVNPKQVGDATKPVKQATLTITDGSDQPAEHAMTRLGSTDPRGFHFALDNIQKTFRYKITTPEGESSNFTITVHPRPSVEQLDVHYDYPSYTGLDPRTDTNKADGAIDAIAGTRVTVIVHTSNNTLKDESRLVVTDRVNGIKGDSHDLPLKRTGEGLYQAQLTLVNDGTYSIKLLNSFDVPNKDDQPRPISVHGDEKPVISITSPTAEMTVRPDDTLPIAYQAADDFGISKVEAYVLVDGATAPQVAQVKITARDRHAFGDTYRMSIKDVLAAATVKDAQKLTYWLRATDNRDPDPQWTESAHQTLRIDKNTSSIEQKLDALRGKDLLEAIRRAIDELGQEKGLADQNQYMSREHHSMTTDEKRRTEELRDRLEKTATNLSHAASEHLTDAYADTATKAKQIADNRITGAAEHAAKTGLHADASDGSERHQEAVAADKGIETARKELEDLLKQVEQEAKNVQSAHELAQLAKQQQELAQQAQQPQATPQENQQQQQQQQDLKNQLQNVLNENQQLQDPKAVAEAQKLADLLNKIDDLQKQQEKQQEQVQKQAALAELQQQANEAAQKQEALNQKIEDFKKNDQKALEQAKADAPKKEQQNQIVQDLNKNNVQQAAQEQKQAAQQLAQAAQQLENKADDNNAQPDAKQQEAQQQAQNKANDLKNQADQAAQQAKNAQQQNNADQKNAAQQQAQKTAEQIADAAKAAEQQGKATEQAAAQTQQQAEAAAKDGQPQAQQAAQQAQQAQQAAQQAQKNAQAAQQAAQAAQQAAQQGNPEQAAQQAQQAAEQLAQADQKNAEAAQAEAGAEQKENAGQAAAEAKQLAAEQQALADAAQAKAAEAAQAQQGAENPQQAAAEQQQLAQQTQQAAQQAAQLQQMAQKQGNDNLAQRADAAKQALKDAHAAQQNAAQAEAQKDAQQAAGAQEKAENALAQAENALRGQQQAAAEQAQDAQANAAEQGKGDQAAPDQGQGEQGKGEQAQGEQGKGEQGKGEQASGEKGQGQPGQGEPGQGEPGQAQAGAQEPHPGEAPTTPAQEAQAATPQQAMQQAAMAAQEAAQAQAQALQGNAPASAEAAQALGQAAQAMAQAGAPHPGEPGTEPGTEPGQEPSPIPGDTADSKMGISSQMAGGSGERPAAVADLGISASDWAKLGPLQQRELLNAAQQGGPPEYQSMIKNYYIRVARMQAQGQSSAAPRK